MKDKVPLGRQVDESIDIHQTEKTLRAWIETLGKVVVDFRSTEQRTAMDDQSNSS